MTEQEQIDALKAQVNCLRDALNKAKDKLSNENIYDNNIRFALQVNPEQCLAEVEIQAIKDFVDYMSVAGSETDVEYYIDTLREQAK